MKTSCRPLSDVSSDLTVEVGTTNFSLHKFPLASRSGKIRKLLSEARDSKVTKIVLDAIPGGPEAFELTAKFCYGVNVELTLSNVAMLRCASHHLEMTEDFSEKNLDHRTEVFINDQVIPNIPNSISVLHRCEALLPEAEDIGLVDRLVSAIASNACKEQLTSSLSRLEHNRAPTETTSDWWGKSLPILCLEFFRRVMSAAKSKGLKQETTINILIDYAHKSLEGFVIVRDDVDSESSKKRRLVVETIVGLLPNRPVPIVLLSGLLKIAATSSASMACRADLERRIGLQLDQAIVEDVLVPANHNASNHPLYDTDSMSRILSAYLNLDEEVDESDDYDDSPRSPKLKNLIFKVSKLLDGYLSEIAQDLNLAPSKFVALAELLPDHARVVTDGLYRAVDIFLKVHPNIKESERYRLCKTIDCQKLSQEACTHAAQNERLPVQMAVQVLYFEQIRLRNAMNGGNEQFFFGSSNFPYPQRSGSGPGSGTISPRDNYASVRRENRELKLEVARMRMRLTDLEKDHVTMKQELVKSNPANRMLRSFTRKLGKLGFLFRMREVKPRVSGVGLENRFLFQRRRRHSIS
ncbi:BTB/POZ domain-containing protein [Acorus gramineus]|uniref:BTB/POZ domain-containing protein n=1 Tax=Acorus gramineus TaxID=55184 RepID=A0AAV9BXZ0_ACOGR|nr:BTB/POZ domain-containing protein [Acorus gramineus]